MPCIQIAMHIERVIYNNMEKQLFRQRNIFFKKIQSTPCRLTKRGEKNHYKNENMEQCFRHNVQQM